MIPIYRPRIIQIQRSTYLANNQTAIAAPSSPTTQQNQQGVEINQNVIDLTNLVRKTHPHFLLIITFLKYYSLWS